MPWNKEKEAPTALLYSAAVEQFIAAKIADGAWKPHSEGERKQRLSLFTEIIGDKPLDAIKREDIRHFRETLRKLPVNRTRSAKYANMTIEEILAAQPENTLNIKTVNQIVESIASLLEWFVREGVLQSNPAKGLQIKDTRQAIELRDAFTPEDLKSIFTHPKFSTKSFKYVDYYWIPLIGLYSGMRLEEIAQLHCADLYMEKESAIWVFDINETGKDEEGRSKTLKNTNARRIVPVHSKLIALGLLNYYQSVKRTGAIRLFPNLQKTDDSKYGKQPGKQFNAIVKTVLGKEVKKSFHSLRHTFADFFKQGNLQTDIFRQTYGHEIPNLASNQYGSKFPPQKCREEIIDLFDPGIDLLALWGKK